MPHRDRADVRPSLRRRLVLAFGILLILFLGLTGLVLDSAFRQSVAAAVEERLQLQIYALVGVAEPDGRDFFLPDLEEARFSQIDSGLYGFIFDSTGRELWRSSSALNIDLRALGFDARTGERGQTVFGRVTSSLHGAMSFASYGTFWPNHNEEFSFVVLESVDPSAAEIREFRSRLWLGLGALAVGLSVIQYFLLRWGLLPLQQLAHDVARVEAGESERLDNSYPAELQAVTDNLNLLIKSERERQSRYRTTLGDLAHSLKTPLAVISGLVHEAGDEREAGADKTALAGIGEQVERMNQIVSWQLKRAVKSNGSRILPRPVPVKPVLEKLLRALEKVYRDKGVSVVAELADDAVFMGEESDLMEIAGNLLDNAFKYGRSRVRVSAARRNRALVLTFADDGAGIAEEHRHWVLERGARADTVKSGQGIGLAVAVDIASSYGAEIRIDTGELGGALIEVSFED